MKEGRLVETTGTEVNVEAEMETFVCGSFFEGVQAKKSATFFEIRVNFMKCLFP